MGAFEHSRVLYPSVHTRHNGATCDITASIADKGLILVFVSQTGLDASAQHCVLPSRHGWAGYKLSACTHYMAMP